MSLMNRIYSRENEMKRSMSVVAAAVACAAMIATSGCSGGGSQEASSIKWGMWIASTDDQKLWQSIGDVGSEKTGVKVELQGSPFNDYWTKIGTQLGSKNAPCIVTMQSGRIRQYSQSLVPMKDLISDLKTDGYDKTALQAMTVDDTLYALPYDSGPAVMFYNKDMFTKAGLKAPGARMTVSEFEAYGKAFKAKGKTLFAPTIESPQLESMVYSYNGGTAISKDGSYNLKDKTYQAGVDWMGGLVKSGTAIAADGTDVSADESAFYSQRVAMHVNGPWSLLDIAEKSKFKVGITTLPKGDGGAGSYSVGSGFGVPKTCKNQRQAAQAIVAMTSNKALTKLADSGRSFPSRTAVQAKWYAEASSLENSKAGMEAILADATSLPSSTKSTQVLQLLSQYGVAAVNGQKTAASVFDQMQSQLG